MSRAACASALEAIEGHFRRLRAPVLDYLAPGLTDAEMDALTEAHGFLLPDDVRAWWAWHNGVLQGGRTPVHPGRCRLTIQFGGPMASLGQALADRVKWLEAEQQHGADDMLPLWTPTWLQLTTFQDSWAVDMGDDYAGSRVFAASTHAGYPRLADTLQELLERWLGFLDSGLIVWRPDSGSWEFSPDAPAGAIRQALGGL
jgi:hypothetical protein